MSDKQRDAKSGGRSGTRTLGGLPAEKDIRNGKISSQTGASLAYVSLPEALEAERASTAYWLLL